MLGDVHPNQMPIKDPMGGGAFVITRYTSSNSGFGFAGKIDNVVKLSGTIYADGYGNLNYTNEITGKTTQLTSE